MTADLAQEHAQRQHAADVDVAQIAPGRVRPEDAGVLEAREAVREVRRGAQTPVEVRRVGRERPTLWNLDLPVTRWLTFRPTRRSWVAM